MGKKVEKICSFFLNITENEYRFDEPDAYLLIIYPNWWKASMENFPFPRFPIDLDVIRINKLTNWPYMVDTTQIGVKRSLCSYHRTAWHTKFGSHKSHRNTLARKIKSPKTNHRRNAFRVIINVVFNSKCNFECKFQSGLPTQMFFSTSYVHAGELETKKTRVWLKVHADTR